MEYMQFQSGATDAAGRLTLGSLFDGSGAFAVAGMLHGIVPVWASEIEPLPIRVTTKRKACNEALLTSIP